MESELLEVNGNQDKLSRSHSELVELQLVLEKAGGFFDEAMTGANTIQEELHMRETFPERALSIEEPLLPDSIELQVTPKFQTCRLKPNPETRF